MRLQLTQLVELLARFLADHADQINVSEINSGKTSIIQLSMAREDLGHIIGKDGRHIEAMRTILTAAAARLQRNAILEILD